MSFGNGDKGTILTSVTVFCTLFRRFCCWLWTSNRLLGYKMVCKCNRKQKYIEVSLIESVIVLIWFWFRNCLLLFSNVRNSLCIGIWYRISGSSISWHLYSGRRLGVRKTISRCLVCFQFYFLCLVVLGRFCFCFVFFFRKFW